ncbi:MAG: hypothetical protein H6739_11950 [Alphaproteobacteria bacterium]|nr:hypothetical protein [Alphaproteobacteria bacterium]
MITDKQLVRTQAASGLAFGAFLALHLINTALGAHSAEAYDGAQRALQVFYQNPLVEITLIGAALVAHVVAAVWLWRRRGGRAGPKPRTWRRRLHRWSGVFLLIFVGGHFLATRGTTLFTGVVLGHAGLSFSLDFAPAYFYPYYALLGLSGLYHGLHGAGQALRVFKVKPPSVITTGWGFRTILALGAAGVLLGIAGFGGWLYPIADPWASDFAALYQAWFG